MPVTEKKKNSKKIKKNLSVNAPNRAFFGEGGVGGVRGGRVF
jgi:hypothetical protein